MMKVYIQFLIIRIQNRKRNIYRPDINIQKFNEYNFSYENERGRKKHVHEFR